MPGRRLVHVVAQTIWPRLRYVCGIVFERLLNVDFELHASDGYIEGGASVLYYLPPLLLKDEDRALEYARLWMAPQGLLAETGTAPVDPNNLDDLSAIFWLVTQYAAYNPAHPHDAHGRPEASLLPNYKDPYTPVCHLLAHRLGIQLGLGEQAPLPLTIEHTLDIDNAFAYAAKGPLRWIGSLGKEILAGKWTDVKRRFSHALGRSLDPFDNHDLILKTFGEENLKVFFLMSDKGKRDRAIPPNHPDFRRLVHFYQDAGACIGLHPSYAGGQTKSSISAEKELLEGMTGKPITLSRYHYLRLLTPHSQRLLLDLGIKDDYSPGPITPGFWQGISVSFPWYDVENDVETDLVHHPAAWMDVHWHQNPEEGLAHIQLLKEALTPYGGNLILIWHNDYFKTYSESSGFEEVLHTS